MYKKILVPVDGSKRAEMAFPHMQELARLYDAEVTILFVLLQTFATGVEGAFIQSIENNAEIALEKAKYYMDRVYKEMRAAGVNIKSQIAQGDVVDSIIATAKNENSDLIIMTSHGRSGVGRVFYGSVAAGVLNRIDRPLLIIRSRTAE